MDKILTAQTLLKEDVYAGVFDGMGGEEHGEEASYAAAATMKSFVESLRQGVFHHSAERAAFLSDMAVQMNQSVWDRHLELDAWRMGTTMAVLCFCADEPAGSAETDPETGAGRETGKTDSESSGIFETSSPERKEEPGSVGGQDSENKSTREIQGVSPDVSQPDVYHPPRGSAIVCNVGDSPIFLFRNGELRKISQEHTDRVFLETQGIEHRKPRLTQFLGMNPDQFQIIPYLAEEQLQGGDQFLICSDGLTDMVAGGQICEVLAREKTAGAAVRELANLALQQGGRDNISILLVRVRQEGEKTEFKQDVHASEDWNVLSEMTMDAAAGSGLEGWSELSEETFKEQISPFPPAQYENQSISAEAGQKTETDRKDLAAAVGTNVTFAGSTSAVSARTEAGVKTQGSSKSNAYPWVKWALPVAMILIVAVILWYLLL